MPWLASARYTRQPRPPPAQRQSIDNTRPLGYYRLGTSLHRSLAPAHTWTLWSNPLCSTKRPLVFATSAPDVQGLAGPQDCAGPVTEAAVDSSMTYTPATVSPSSPSDSMRLLRSCKASTRSRASAYSLPGSCRTGALHEACQIFNLSAVLHCQIRGSACHHT